MELICLPRNGGKTDTLIEMASKNVNRTIICSSEHEAIRIHERALCLGLHIRKPIPFHKFLTGYPNHRINGTYLIDNIELLLKNTYFVDVEAITMTHKHAVTLTVGE